MIVFILAVFGMIFGSFANALVWRLHGQESLEDDIAGLEDEKPGKARDRKIAGLRQKLAELSMGKGRSMCSACRHPLAPKDLVPLFSWIWLRGKCRYCHGPIQDPPLMEIGLPVLFVASYLLWPMEWSGYGVVSFGFWLVFLVAFIALTLYDIRWFLLPDKIVWPLVGLAILQVLLHAFVFGGGLEVLVTAFWGVVTASGIFYLLYQVSRGEWIGGGDVKLGIVLGLLVGGPMQGLLLIFIASLLGTVASLPMLFRSKSKRSAIIPFGPFLMAATVILILAGNRLVDWFTTLMLY